MITLRGGCGGQCARALAAAALVLGLAACAAYDMGGDYDDEGYGYPAYANVGVGYDMDFFQPFGYDYGGWGGEYNVGPWPGGYPQGVGGWHGGAPMGGGWHGGGGGAGPMRPAGPPHAMPSIPLRPGTGARGRWHR